jgi:hypothetical protein
MPERTEKYKQRLADSRQYVDSVLDQVGDRWQRQVYSEGAAWNVLQLGIHLMVSDKGQNNTVMAIARGENNIPEDFDLERYNRRSVEKRADTTPEQIRASLNQSRAELFAWLDTIDDATLDQQGRHATLQILTIAQFLNVMANHERQHAEDIARALDIKTAPV